MIKKLWQDKFIRFGCYVLFFFLISLILFEIIYKSYCQGQLLGSDINYFVTTIREFFQILFFCVVITVTILSYLQAKKTLFTPIKTEIFKMQIKAFDEIILFFQNKNETDFLDQFDYQNIFNINAQFLNINYIQTFFKNDIEIDWEIVRQIKNNTVGGVATTEYMNKNYEKTDYINIQKINKNEYIIDRELLLQKWAEYEFGKIEFTKQFQTEKEKLQNLSASPLIPQELKDKINAFDKKTQNNLFVIGRVLTEFSKELPIKFTDPKSLDNFNHLGLWNLFNSEMEHFENDAKEILIYIRQYLKIDELIK